MDGNRAGLPPGKAPNQTNQQTDTGAVVDADREQVTTHGAFTDHSETTHATSPFFFYTCNFKQMRRLRVQHCPSVVIIVVIIIV